MTYFSVLQKNESNNEGDCRQILCIDDKTAQLILSKEFSNLDNTENERNLIGLTTFFRTMFKEGSKDWDARYDSYVIEICLEYYIGWGLLDAEEFTDGLHLLIKETNFKAKCIK